VSTLSVMIASGDEPFGVLGALSTRRRTFSPSEVSFVQSVANVLASAIERSRTDQRLAEVLEGRAQPDRSRPARRGAAGAHRRARPGRSRPRRWTQPDAADRLGSTLRHIGEQLRAAIYDLCLTDDTRPFPEALRALVDVQRALAVDSEIDLDIAGETAIGVLGNRGSEVLRIVGEALTNARRHSGARRIHVSARESQGRLCVEVTDNGRGFDPAGEPSSARGRGLQGMRERAALLSATSTSKSPLGTGTTARIELRGAQHHGRPRAARILLVEDHATVRDAIAAMFEHEPDLDVVAQAASLAEARALLRDIDVAVLDLGLPDGNGADLISELRDVNPRAQALILSATLDLATTARAVDSGASATLHKIADLDELVNAVRRLHHGADAPP
jgi:CheY-like chemotaxis protein